MTEKEIETQIISFLRQKGFWTTKVQSGMVKKAYCDKKGMERSHWIHLAESGTPDILSCVNGQFVAIEVKKSAKEIEKWEREALSEKRSADQHEQQERIRQSGGITIVACSVEEVEADLQELKLIK